MAGGTWGGDWTCGRGMGVGGVGRAEMLERGAEMGRSGWTTEGGGAAA